MRDDRVYCWCERTSAKARNVARTGTAALTAYKGHGFVMVRGRASIVDASDARYDDIARAFLEKYQREETYGNDALIEIVPDHIASARI